MKSPKLLISARVRNHFEIVGENKAPKGLWITGIFAHMVGPVGRKLRPIYSPTVSEQFKPSNADWATWAKWAKSTFRPSPRCVGGLGESPYRTRPPRPARPENSAKRSAAELWKAVKR